MYENEKFNGEEKKKLKDKIESYEIKLRCVNKDYMNLKYQVQDLQDNRNMLLKKNEKNQIEIKLLQKDLVLFENCKQKVHDMQLRLNNFLFKH